MDKTPLDRIYEIAAPAAAITEARQTVAEACGVTRQAVEHWEKDGVPGKHLLTLETLAKRRVTMREILEWSLRQKAAA